MTNNFAGHEVNTSPSSSVNTMMNNDHHCFSFLCASIVLLSIVDGIWSLDAGSICKTPNGERGYCISLYECDPILDAISSRTLDALRFAKQSHCGCDESEPLICCGSHSNFLPTESPSTPANNHTVTENTPHSTDQTEQNSAMTMTQEGDTTDESKEDENPEVCERVCGCKRKDDVFGPRCLDAGDICKTPNGETANCISLYECDVILDAISLRTMDSLNFSKQSHCGCDDSEPLVCCGSHSGFMEIVETDPPPIPSTQMETTTTERTTTSPTTIKTTTSTTEIPTTKAMPTKRAESVLNNTLLANRKICGYKGKDGFPETKKFTQNDEHPWLGVIYSDTSNRPVCFGSLISKRYVLTSASCLMANPKYPRRITRVRLGEYDISRNGVNCAIDPDFDECSEPPIDYRVESITVHEDFNRDRNYDNDIGLIRLSRNVRYTDYARPICLPDATTKQAMIGDVLQASGWGYLRKQGQIARIKKKASFQKIDEEECKMRLQGEADVYMPHLMLCTKYVKKGPCLGDTGIPVMFSRDHQWHQEGIVSFARDEGYCGEEIVLSTRVIEYIDWIQSNVKP